MPPRIVPMIHVPDVAATADWYVSIGFKVVDIGELDGQASWALLSFGTSEIMLNEGGKPSSEHRREFDLYIYVDDVDKLCEFMKSKAEFVEDVHDTFYSMREFIVRDCNRFWITFGQSVERATEFAGA
ncbi:MAG: VOC family protein [Candidatus Sulfotelmatobacter sp.]